jgi:hypothetical protein
MSSEGSERLASVLTGVAFLATVATSVACAVVAANSYGLEACSGAAGPLPFSAFTWLVVLAAVGFVQSGALSLVMCFCCCGGLVLAVVLRSLLDYTIQLWRVASAVLSGIVLFSPGAACNGTQVAACIIASFVVSIFSFVFELYRNRVSSANGGDGRIQLQD